MVRKLLKLVFFSNFDPPRKLGCISYLDSTYCHKIDQLTQTFDIEHTLAYHCVSKQCLKASAHMKRSLVESIEVFRLVNALEPSTQSFISPFQCHFWIFHGCLKMERVALKDGWRGMHLDWLISIEMSSILTLTLYSIRQMFRIQRQGLNFFRISQKSSGNIYHLFR